MNCETTWQKNVKELESPMKKLHRFLIKKTSRDFRFCRMSRPDPDPSKSGNDVC